MLLLVLLVSVTAGPVLGKLPANFTACAKNTSELNECFLNSSRIIMPYLRAGIPELNLPSLEPLVVPMVKLEQGTSAVKVRVGLKNLTVHGLTHYLFREINIDLGPSPKVSGSVWLQGLHLVADYDINGKVLLVPLRGNGVLDANATNIIAEMKINLERKVTNEKEYLEVVDLNLKLSFGDVKLMLHNLFNGDELGQVASVFVHENSKQIFHELKPAVESVATMLVQDIVSRVFRSTPEEELFPAN